MNKSYIRLFISNVLLIIILLLNSYFTFFNSYTIILFLLVYLFIMYKFLGFERDNFRYKKDIIINILIIGIAYYILTYILGIFVGFNKTGYSLKILSILKNIIPLIFTIIISVLIRYVLITKSSQYKSLIVLTIISMIMIDVNLLISNYINELLRFILTILIPSISKNILLAYVTYKVGYKPSIIYRFLFEIPVFILPIFPTFGMYIDSLLQLLFPLLLAYILYYNFSKIKSEKIISRREIKPIRMLLITIINLFIITMILMISGFLKYTILTIGSNSMLPYISKGDLVLVEKLNNNEKGELKKGDILVFNHNNVIIVHRILKIINVNNEKYYYTKGDNNNGEDGYPILNHDIIGKSITRIKYLGYPTVSLSELVNK